MTQTATNRGNVIKIALVLVFGALAPMLDTTMTNVAINTIMHDLNSTVNTVQWVTTAYVLVLGIVVPVTGWAIEWFSGKKLYLLALTLFLIGSVVSGLATTINVLIIGRVIQGIGTGIIMPLLTTLIVRASGGMSLGSLMSIVGLPAVLAPVLGPTIGGFIIDSLDWHWIFYINVPIVLLSFALLLWAMPEFSPSGRGKPLDVISLGLLAGMFTAFIFGITHLSTSGSFAESYVLLPLFIGLDLLAAYVIYAKVWPKRALVSLDLFRVPNFSASAVLLLMSGLTVNGAMFLLPLYLQNIRGLSVVWSGIYLIAQGAGVIASRGLVGRVTDRIGARWVVLVSVVIAIAGTLPFAYFDADTNKLIVLVVLLVRGVAQGGLTIPVMSDSYVGIPKPLIAEATTATRMLQNIGGAFGTAVLATVIQSQINGMVPTTGHLTGAYQTAFIWTVVGTGLAVIPAWFLSHRTTSAQDDASQKGDVRE